MVPLKRPKSLFKFDLEASITWDCTHKDKLNFEGFIKIGCYGNHPHLSVAAFVAFTPTVVGLLENKISISNKHIVWIYAPLCDINQSFYNKILEFKSTFFRFYFGVTPFCTKPSGRVMSCHVTHIKWRDFFGLYHDDTIGL